MGALHELQEAGGGGAVEVAREDLAAAWRGVERAARVPEEIAAVFHHEAVVAVLGAGLRVVV